ncbi:unnamed protein product [Ceutorhynchus assimilis]|uniref:Ubiquitin-like protease family profile domain-containing protein n=1 Tax=Ceutorhynchus assimilis TaxID=467358 RepID=A0A9N9MXB3_9CUCU|nr:unnamed protein product [Ceutorhynchus assimilis]
MEQPFKNILDYIKSLFSINPLERTRKRSAAGPIFESRSKLCRLSPYSKPTTTTTSRYIPIHRESEDLSPYFPRNFNPVKRLSRSMQRSPMKPVKVQETVVLDDDDDDDVIEITKPARNGKKFTSTPLERRKSYANVKKDHENSDDIVFIKTFKSPKEKQKEAKLAGYDYFKPRTSLDKPLFTIGSTHNGTKPKAKPTKYKTLPLKSRGASTSNYSFRLDDKLKYKQLLDCVSGNDSSIYGTPIGKISSYDFANKPKESTKDRINRVLDNWDSDSLVIKDSDSEGSVVMVKPPSPKPDIKVDPVNSFKHYVDSSNATKKDWLTEVVENHKQYVKDRQKEIDNLRVCTEATSKINKDINIELLRRKVDNCLQIKDVVLPETVLPEEDELPELTDEHLSMVSRAHRGDPNEVLVNKFNLRVTRRDLMTLAGLNWLNDEVINFYMNLIMERGENSKWPKSYAFNTFFYPKLLKDGAQSLRRWTRRVDLFSYDLICVPVHLGMHWCMAMIDFRNKSIKYYDSMGSPNSRCLDALRHYLEAEHLDKKGSKYNTRDFKLENRNDIPQQMNGSDCGMFACTFAEFLTRDAQISFKQEDMPYMRKKMVVEIMTGQLLIQ